MKGHVLLPPTVDELSRLKTLSDASASPFFQVMSQALRMESETSALLFTYSSQSGLDSYTSCPTHRRPLA